MTRRKWLAMAGNVAAVRAATERDRFGEVRALLRRAVEKKQLAGCSLLLARGGKPLFLEAHGMADIEQNKPFRTDSIVHLASSTKWISATACMILVDDRKLRLDDPLGEYLPGCRNMRVKGSPEKANPTFRQCFSHTAGFAGIARGLGDPSLSLAESVQSILQEQPELAYRPGTDFRYGGVSFQMAGAAIELIAGKPFEAFLRERIFEPLGMTDTTFNPAGDRLARTGPVYAPETGGKFRVVLPPPNGANKNARVAGGLYSALNDYGRFLEMHLGGGVFRGKRLLSQDSVLEMRKDQTGGVPMTSSPYASAPGAPRYGLGIWLNEAEHGRGVVVSDGGAYGTKPWLDARRGYTAVFFTQTPLRAVFGLTERELPPLVQRAMEAN